MKNTSKNFAFVTLTHLLTCLPFMSRILQPQRSHRRATVRLKRWLRSNSPTPTAHSPPTRSF
jgi:hypothetical protein